MPPNKLAALLSIVLLLSGCAVGVTHQLDTAVPTVRTTGKDSAFVVSSHDQRPYVRSGAKPESFVGLSRGGFGNPFDVNTASGNGLASDISKALANALSANGAQVEIIAVTPHEQETVFHSKLAARKVKAVLVTISEWKSDTYMSVRLHYDLAISVIGADGKVSARKSVQGTEDLGGSAINPPEASRQSVPPALKRKLEQLLTAPEIASEL